MASVAVPLPPIASRPVASRCLPLPPMVARDLPWSLVVSRRFTLSLTLSYLFGSSALFFVCSNSLFVGLHYCHSPTLSEVTRLHHLTIIIEYGRIHLMSHNRPSGRSQGLWLLLWSAPGIIIIIELGQEFQSVSFFSSTFSF